MPNHVTHKLTFSAEADRIFSVIAPGGSLSFATLISPPVEMYCGDLASRDEEDFPCNWLSWSREHWGTKWDAYQTKIDGPSIQFDTAWSIPYPFITALANTFCIPFEHRYFDEGPNFWGIETWGFRSDFKNDPPVFQRMTKRRDDPTDKVALCLELKGYDPNEA